MGCSAAIIARVVDIRYCEAHGKPQAFRSAGKPDHAPHCVVSWAILVLHRRGLIGDSQRQP
jgi:hypothetical protein